MSSFFLLTERRSFKYKRTAVSIVVFPPFSNSAKKAQGSRKFVQLSLLEDQHFMDRNGEFQIELSLSAVRSTFEHRFKVNQSIFANTSKLGKFETTYFSYGAYDWSLAVYPNGRADSQLGTQEQHSQEGGANTDGSSGMTIFLNRHTGLDRSCRVKFNLRVGSDGPRNVNSGGTTEGPNAAPAAAGMLESGVRDEMSDSDGKSYGWLPRAKMADLVSKGSLKLVADMISVNTASVIELAVCPPNPIGTPLYDKDRLAWELEPELTGDTLRLRLVHKDAKNIPRNHIRYTVFIHRARALVAAG